METTKVEQLKKLLKETINYAEIKNDDNVFDKDELELRLGAITKALLKMQTLLK